MVSYNKGESNGRWKGGRTRKSKGYILIHCPDHPNANIDGYIFEHRLVMEKHIGRTLTRAETVHHINGDILDNRIENLQLYSSNGEHLKKTLSFSLQKK